MVNAPFWTPFVTPVGVCGIAWNDAGITGLQLPERSDAALHSRMAARFRAERADTPSACAREAIDAIGALLRGEGVADVQGVRRGEEMPSGEPVSLARLRLDMTRVPDFHQRVYAIARRIPPGKTLTYGDIAERLGGRVLSRAVGQALGRNPFAIIVPCHRIVPASGGLGGFSAHTGVTLKARLLELEGWRPSPSRCR